MAATRSSRWRRSQSLASCLAASWTGSRGCGRRTWPHADARRVATEGSRGRAAPGVRPRGAAVRPDGARRLSRTPVAGVKAVLPRPAARKRLPSRWEERYPGSETAMGSFHLGNVSSTVSRLLDLT